MASKTIWTLPTRILHWTLAVSVLLNLFVFEEGEDNHEWSGYIAVGSVVLRLLWSFFGSEKEKLTALPIHPKTVFNYLRKLPTKHSVKYEGHNPLASLVYICIWICIFGLGMTGWMLDWDRFFGEDWLKEIHANFSVAMETLIILHLLGLAVDSLRYRHHNWTSMMTGRKQI